MTTKTVPSTVCLRGRFDYKELPLFAQTLYGGAITPGMLIERTSTNCVRPHSTSTGLASAIFAVENPINAGHDINTDYDIDGETVLFVDAAPGAEVLAFLAAGQDVAIGATLSSNGAGYLTASSTNPVARAIEAVDNNPGTDGAPVRIRVEVL